MIQLPTNIQVSTVEKRTIELSLNGHGLRGDDFISLEFVRESVFLDSEGAEVKRVRDMAPFEFTPEQIDQAPDLKQAVETFYKYMDWADSERMKAQTET